MARWLAARALSTAAILALQSGRSEGWRSSACCPAGTTARAYGINDSRVVVGSSNTGTIVRPFIWTSGQGMRPLPSLPGHRGGEALAINNDGDVVGYSTGATGAVAVLWTSDGEIVRIGTLPGGTSSRAVAINRRGAGCRLVQERGRQAGVFVERARWHARARHIARRHGK